MDTLVIVDYHNVYRLCKDKIRLDDVFMGIFKTLEETGETGQIRIFVPNYQEPIAWKTINYLMIQYGIKTETCFTTRESEEWMLGFKDVVDIAVFDWVKDNLHPGVGPSKIAFVTHDGHYLMAYNEAVLRKQKKTEFWVIDPEDTNDTIKKHARVKTINLMDVPVAVPTEGENLFITALHKKIEGTTNLDSEEEKRIEILKKIADIVSSMEPPYGTSTTSLINLLTKTIRGSLALDEETSREAIEVLANIGIIKFHPVVVQTYLTDRSSHLLEWFRFAP